MARQRKLGLIDVLAIGVNAIVGSGVFSMPGRMHEQMGGFSPLAYLLCATLLMPVALSFAELAGRSDKTGGPYLYATEAFGRLVGFVVGWSCWLNSFLSWAAVTNLFVHLLGIESPVISKLLVAGTIVFLGAINFVGVRPGAAVVQMVVVGKVSAILLFVVAALLAAHPGHLGGELPRAFSGVGSGVYLALFPLQGFEVVSVPAGETKNPRRNVPIATIGALLFSAVLFVIVQASIELAYPLLEGKSYTPLVDAARYLGPTVGLLVFIGSLVSMGGFSAGSALGTPRYAQAIAENGQLPRPLASIHPRFDTPYIAIVTTTVIAATLGVLFNYDQLVGFSNVTIIFQYVLSCAAVPVLRWKDRKRGTDADPEKKRFRVPWGMLLPIVGALGSLFLLSNCNVTEGIWAACGIGLGIPVALLSWKLYPATAKSVSS